MSFVLFPNKNLSFFALAGFSGCGQANSKIINFFLATMFESIRQHVAACKTIDPGQEKALYKNYHFTVFNARFHSDSILLALLDFPSAFSNGIFAPSLIKNNKTMKKHIIILAAAITPLAFISCKKEKIETQQSESATNEIAFKPIIKPVVKLDSSLVGLYEFDGNLKEKSGQLGDAIATIFGADNYTDDRKGNQYSAIKFNGRYGLDIFKVPLAANMSASVWAKYDFSAGVSTNYFVWAGGGSPAFAQEFDSYSGVINVNGTTGVQDWPVDDQWHHLVATYDGNRLKFYVDGNYIGTSININLWLPYPNGANIDYQLGYMGPQGGKNFSSVWHGTLDDLRLYTRVLSSADIKALYQL